LKARLLGVRIPPGEMLTATEDLRPMTTAAREPPAKVGAGLEDVDTPALLLDLDAFERNLEALDALVAESSVRLRPHAKPHKCPEIARRQIARGAMY
jgi:hypothetical protein